MKGIFGYTGILWVISLVLLFQCTRESLDLPRHIDFNYHIRPIFTQNCFTCHGPDSTSRKANLRLDTYEGATALLVSNNHAVVPGNLKRSEMIERINSEDPKLIMPPPETKKKLSDYEIALIQKWIKQGAKWKKHWAFIPAQESNLKFNNIDSYIQEKIDENKLVKSKSANKNTLIRRVSYLLTGLPPSVAEIGRFENTDYEEMVDYYINSPHFGEHWARHWMDLVRYAEGMGHEFDFPIGGAWQYRDYLIRAFNSDLPYNMFVKEHLAGDLLDVPRINDQKGINESIIGTAYAFLGEGKHSPVDIKKEEADRIDNMIDVTSKTFQGLTVSCAKCHDHKFDPIPTTDYYAMYGMFESARIGPLFLNQSPSKERIVEKINPINEKLKNEIELFFHQEEPFEEISDKRIIADFKSEDFGSWKSSGNGFGEKPLFGKMASSRYYGRGIHGVLRSPNFIIQDSFIYFSASGAGSTARIIVDNFQLIQNPLYGNLETRVDNEVPRLYKMGVSALIGHKAYIEFLSGHYDKHLYSLDSENYIEIRNVFSSNQNIEVMEIEEVRSLELSSNVASLYAEKDSLSKELRDTNFVMGLNEGDVVFSPVFIRGSHTDQSKEKVPHQFLTAISEKNNKFNDSQSARLQWAQVVIDPENPLTSRVMVNRIWHHLFGRGIVESVDNFGLQGTLPSHPELLDYLALSFIKKEWSVKMLIKEIVMSKTFQTSARINLESQKSDPENRYLASFPIRRLEAESIRDGILKVSGSLDTNLFGQSIPIYLSEFMTGRGKPAVSGPLDGQGRRSIYMSINRNFLPEMMLTFDMPIPFSTFGKRNTTNVPAQSLTLMNDPFIHDQALKWAESLEEGGFNRVEEKIEEIYMTAFGRLPSEMELIQTKKIINSFNIENEKQAWKEYCHLIFNMKEFIHLM